MSICRRWFARSWLICSLLKLPRSTLQNGKRKIRVDELFNISGNDAQNIVIKNSFGKLDFIGKELNGGRITVEGDAGAYLGLGMKSGEIEVTGNVGLYAACEMKKGYA